MAGPPACIVDSQIVKAHDNFPRKTSGYHGGNKITAGGRHPNVNVRSATALAISCGRPRTTMSGSQGGFSLRVKDAGRDIVLLAEGEQAAAVDEVQRLSGGELVAFKAVAGGGDHDSLGCILVLHGAPQVADMGWLDSTGVPLGLDDELSACDGCGS